MLNRRKAMIGWLVYTAGKPLAKRALKQRAKSAKSAVPGTAGAKGSGAPKGALLAGVAALVGGLLFWRSRKADDDGGGSGGPSGSGAGESSES